MPSVHAVCSASSAHRWLACTPSVRLEETIKVETPSKFAEEGTHAHSLCELKLRQLLGKPTEPLDFEPDAEMQECTDAYRDFVEEKLNAAKAITPDAALFIEQPLRFDDYVPEGFGTSDAVIVSDKLLEVIDFKYGKGVAVDAENNPQLRLYALGAYLSLSVLYDFAGVKTVVFQPRLNSVTSETLTVEALLKWADDVVRPRAKLAFNGEGEFCVGSHCQFCKAKAVCRARAEAAFGVMEKAKELPPVIDDTEIEQLLDKLDDTEKWIAAIREYAEDKAIREGFKWKGYKLVESRTQRKITDPIKAAEELRKAGYSDEDFTNTKLKGLSDLEKLVGKANFNKILGDYVIKPEGSPTLVKESDKRKEINPIQNAFKEE